MLLFTNIKELVGTHNPLQPLRGKQLNILPSIKNAYLLVNELGCIDSFGSINNLPTIHETTTQIIDCNNGYILPCYCDSHTHIVYAGSRENEFVQKINGATYATIAASGGGIINSALLLQQTTEANLYETALQRINEVIALGTGAIEIKSGYGLTVAAELKMLSVIKKLKETVAIPIKATYLAHTFPTEYKQQKDEYVSLIIETILPTILNEQLADYIDVFCENDFFTVAQLEQIMVAAAQYNVPCKIHTNQLNSIGGLQKAIALNAISVDHLETMTEQDCTDLGNSNTIGTLLPTAAYYLRMPYQPAQQLINANAALAIASDYNPGSSPSGNMNMVVSMSCIQLKMLPEAAINAATINGAFAMQVQHMVGSITVGKLANLILTKPIPSLAYMPYSFGTNHIQGVYIKGVLQTTN